MIKNFNTTDIVLAATLKLKGYKIDEIICSGGKGTFIFNGVKKEDITEFDLGHSLVEPVTFNNMIKQLTTSVRRQQSVEN